MKQEVSFSQEACRRYADRLKECLNSLETLLKNPQFGIGPNSLGAEMEVSIVDKDFKSAPINQEILADLQDENLQCELDKFNLEYNALPVFPKDNPFSKIKKQLEEAIARMNQSASRYNSQIIPIGILPTLTLDELSPEVMTKLKRYQLLSERLRSLRGAPFKIDIEGEEKLQATCDDVTLEGANTSYQLHLRVNPAEFAETFNAVQLMTPLAVAISTNSPFFLGKKLWEETRIALFQQSVDYRDLSQLSQWHLPNRVAFGYGWIRKSAFECFAENVAIFPPLIPMTTDEEIEKTLAQGKTPRLKELRLHQGVVWQWNRAIFDPADGGHLRIEMRALPSGPTPEDMAANSAFLIGLAFHMRKKIEKHIQTLPFKYAEENFYRAAKFGLDAQIIWFSPKTYQLELTPIASLLHWGISKARKGLAELGVSEAEIDHYMKIIEVRLQRRMTGARWQKKMVEKLEQAGQSREKALAAMTEAYLQNSARGQPVGEWEVK